MTKGKGSHLRRFQVKDHNRIVKVMEKWVKGELTSDDADKELKKAGAVISITKP